MSAAPSDLFGTVDIEALSADLESGTYLFELKSVKYKHSPDKKPMINFGRGKHQIIFTWEVADEDNEFYGETFSQWFNIFPGITDDDIKRLSPEERKKFKGALRFLKMQIENIGLDSSNYNFKDMEEQVGIRRYIDITTSTNEDGSQGFTKVNNMVNPDDLDNDDTDFDI